MSIVVEIRECRIDACTDFGSTPASHIQVARDVRSERQVAFYNHRYARAYAHTGIRVRCVSLSFRNLIPEKPRAFSVRAGSIPLACNAWVNRF